MDLSQARHAFVTGGASGIGLGIVDALTARGVPVTVADIDAEALAKVTAARGNSVRGALLDTRIREQWQRAKAEAEAAFGPVDVLVNNAGIGPDGLALADGNAESFDRVIAINLMGVYNGILTFAGDMRERGRGHIVNTSSQAGLITSILGVGSYSVAKFGVMALSESLRAELAEHGIGVSVLCPGHVPTNLDANTARIAGVPPREHMPNVKLDAVSAAEVGRIVADGIERNASHIITHKNVWPGVEARMLEIKTECLFREAQ